MKFNWRALNVRELRRVSHYIYRISLAESILFSNMDDIEATLDIIGPGSSITVDGETTPLGDSESDCWASNTRIYQAIDAAAEHYLSEKKTGTG